MARPNEPGMPSKHTKSGIMKFLLHPNAAISGLGLNIVGRQDSIHGF